MLRDNLPLELTRWTGRASKARALVRGRFRALRTRVTGDTSILLPLAAHAHYWSGLHDDVRSFAFLSDSLRTNGVFFDVGANIGVYLSTIGALKGRALTLVGFEPIPTTLVILQQTLALNGVTARIEPIALSRSEGELRLSAYSRGMNNFWIKHDTHEHPSISVRTLSLDAWLAEGTKPEPDAIKVDVEGHELEVLEGAFQLLVRKRPALMVECHGAAWDELGVPRTRFRDLLGDAGYKNLRFSTGEPADFVGLQKTAHLFAT